MARSATDSSQRSGSQITSSSASGPTITTTNAPSGQPVLRLRGADAAEGEVGTRRGPRIQWAEDVIDNEGMGKKKSKVCCIYHAPKGIDESSDESSSDSDSDESDGGDDGSARPTRGGKKSCGNGHDHGKGKGKGRPRERSPNAYEKMPTPKTGAIKEKS